MPKDGGRKECKGCVLAPICAQELSDTKKKQIPKDRCTNLLIAISGPDILTFNRLETFPENCGQCVGLPDCLAEDQELVLAKRFGQNTKPDTDRCRGIIQIKNQARQVIDEQECQRIFGSNKRLVDEAQRNESQGLERPWWRDLLTRN